MIKGKILWLSPPDATPAINVMNIWKKYFGEYKDWTITANKDDDYDIVFFGSDSVLDKEILEDASKFKICYFWGWPWFRLGSGPWVDHYRRGIELLKKCDMVLAGDVVSFYQLYDFGIPNSVCYGGIDSKIIDSVPSQEKELQVCACGRLVDYKMFDVIIKAVALLNPQPKVVIIGKGEEGEKLKKIAKELKVDLKIKSLTDFEKIKEYKKSVCLISPYIYGGFAMVPLEALYSGIPVIVLDIPVNREILKENALYFTGGKDLASKLVYVINNAPKGNKEYAKNFTFEKASERLNFFFERAMKIQEERTNPHWERHWRANYIIPELEGKVLDAGCGIGIYSIRIAEEGHDVVAVDINGKNVEAAKRLAKKYKANKIKALKADLFALPFEDNEFDSVYLGEVIEHFGFQSLSNLMLEIIRVTGKRIVGTTPIGYHHYDQDHKTIWNDKSIEIFLNSLRAVDLVKLEKIAEPKKEKSCYLFVLEKRSGDYGG